MTCTCVFERVPLDGWHGVHHVRQVRDQQELCDEDQEGSLHGLWGDRATYLLILSLYCLHGLWEGRVTSLYCKVGRPQYIACNETERLCELN